MSESRLLPDVLEVKYSEMMAALRETSGLRSAQALNIAFLRNITIEPFIPFFQYQCMLKGVTTNAYLCDFDNIMQDVLDENSGLYQHEPKIIFVFIKLEQLIPRLFLELPQLSKSEADELIEEVLNFYAVMLNALREKTDALIACTNFEVNPYPSAGVMDSQHINGETGSVRRLNENLRSLIGGYSGVLVLDLELVSSRVGLLNYYNNTQWHMSKMPFTNQAIRHVAAEASKYVIAAEGAAKKCIVLDCDNTLWGGIVGEDGVGGILLDQNHPGSYFLQFQRDLLNLKSQGILLAICSKNNEDDVVSAFRDNGNMLLSEQDFAAMQVNWDLKVENIKKISQELNLGLQHIVFVDDSEFEIEMVKELLPEVTSVLVPSNLSDLKYIFDDKGYFDKIQETEIDANRTEMYRAESERKKKLEEASDLADYYHSLQLVAQVGKINESEVARVAQLTQKTNQFNLTTRRYTEHEIEGLMRSNESEVITLKADDKFGSYGLIGVAILRYKEARLEIDTFLMSCRAIGRGLEDVLFNESIKNGTAKGLALVTGSFSRTKKNEQVENFFENHGFRIITNKSGYKEYECDLAKVNTSKPNHIRVT